MNNKGFISFLGLIVAIAIVCFLAFKVFRTSLAPDVKTQRSTYDNLKSQVKSAQDIKIDQSQRLFNDAQ